MAATDQTYRNQRTLDVVFGVSSLLMLVSVVLMFVQDYYRPWKIEQKVFLKTESVMAEREALGEVFAISDRYDDAMLKVVKALSVRKDKQKQADDLDAEIKADIPNKERQDQKTANFKSELASKQSFYNIAVEKHGPESTEAKHLATEVGKLGKELADEQAKSDEIKDQLRDKQRRRDELDRALTLARAELTDVSGDLLRKVRTALKKQWGWADWFRSLPIIDGFASPTKIEQTTINDLTIDYNFKGVTRFDRCTTCHKGIDRASYTKDKLRSLLDMPEDHEKRLSRLKEILRELKEAFAGTPDANNVPDPDQIKITKMTKEELTDARVNEFCAHPRLELFVGSNSKHPSEKFGCTSCHGGQPSGTDFKFASHTPNNHAEKKRWGKDHNWENIHDWDFPMLPKRFIEASCLKCHHQVTDLVATNHKEEAPKLLRGYNLIRENGCFGCHEIAGTKKGQSVGPDLRLEAKPPLEDLTAEERARVLADTENLPGNLRKVGPSLYRIKEKTHHEFVSKWVMGPRDFRPTTRMPHYYNLTNNDPAALKGTGQEKFPEAEVYGITQFLFEESDTFLANVLKYHAATPSQRVADEQKVRELTAELADKQKVKAMLPPVKEAKDKELDEARQRIALRKVPMPIHPLTEPKEEREGDAANGRKLFTMKGCLACHQHIGTEKPFSKEDEDDPRKSINIPAAPSTAVYGPDLSQLPAKLLTKDKKNLPNARRWLVQWIMDPHVHSPRSKMPVTHLNKDEAGDIAAWLLEQPADRPGADWDKLQVNMPDHDTLTKLARVYLDRIMPRYEVEKFLGGEFSSDRIKELPVDERMLAERLKPAAVKEKAKQSNLKTDEAVDRELSWYVGRRAVGRLGCFGCHDIPGFDSAKPIGVGLNDWGKKDPARLAFEDIKAFIKDKYHVVPSLVDPDGKFVGDHHGKPPYEQFFADQLGAGDHAGHHAQTREGYLNQKIREPRSYDYQRKLAWDDRARMPQFKFDHAQQLEKESKEALAMRKAWDRVNKTQDAKGQQEKETPAEYKARADKAEADARESVMTFVLGLVAEPIPPAYLNRPDPERMAVVKGRQVLEKYNCNGCHLVQPGVYEFKRSKETLALLDGAYDQDVKEKLNEDYRFLNHLAWHGRPQPAPDKLKMYGVRAGLNSKGLFSVRLTEALNYQTVIDAPGLGARKREEDRDIPGGGSSSVVLPPGDLLLPSGERFQDYERRSGAYGGAFSDLLATYLSAVAGQPGAKEDDKRYGDLDKARHFGPPSLLWQGERTQPDWLFRFLLNPNKVRELTVLRMPRFNMSDDEAKALVNFFGAVDKLNNSRNNLEYPYFKLPQRSELGEEYWRHKTTEYLARLEKKGLLKKELEDLQPQWEKVLANLKAESEKIKTPYDKYKKPYEEALAKVTKAKKALDTAEEALKDEKDGKKAEPLKKAVAEAKKEKDAADKALKPHQDVFEVWDNEKARLDEQLLDTTVEKQKERWEKYEAYPVGAYRLAIKVCSSCHQMGSLNVSNQTKGPSLNLAAERLRPDWTQKWIANPSRLVPYISIMPQNFAAHKPYYPELFEGTPLEQVTAIRDILMNFPQVSELPLNRNWLITRGTGEKQ